MEKFWLIHLEFSIPWANTFDYIVNYSSISTEYNNIFHESCSVSDNWNLSRIPSLAYLMAFERAAFHLSFSKAAEDLGRTPSAISHAINELEEKLECSLFRRVGRKVILTDAGDRYLHNVRTALHSLDHGQKYLKNIRHTSVIRIRMAPVIASLYVIPEVSEFERKHPDLKLEINIDRREIIGSTPSFDADIQLGNEKATNLNVFDLGTIRSVPICSPKLIKGPDKLIQIEDLQKHVIIHDTHIPDNWSNWLSDAGYPDLKTGGNLILNDPFAVFIATTKGLGVSLSFYNPTIRQYLLNAGMVLPFGNKPGAGYNYKFITHHDLSINPNMTIVYEWLKTIIKKVS